MNSYKVTHVSKDSYGDITAIGVKKVPGVVEGWRLSISEAITRIESGQEGYYVLLPLRAEIIVKQGPYRKYLATTADSTTQNNLDSLPAL